MDFLRNRSFRQTLLVREGQVVNRSVPAERVMTLRVSSALRPVSAGPAPGANAVEEFRAADGGSLRTPNAITQAAMRVLAGCWPGSLAFPDLLARARAQLARREAEDETTLASDLLQCYGSGLLDLHTTPDTFVTHPGDRPLAYALARLQAGRGNRQVTSLRHETVPIDDNLARLLALLDGRRSRKDIHAAVTDWVLRGPAGRGRSRKELAGPVGERVDQTLAQLASAALLLA